MLIEIIALTFLCLFIGISQSVGLGGGPIINVILTIGLGIQMKQSVHITYLFLFGASLATIISNIKKKNPNNGGPLMDYNLIMMTLPMVSSGSLIGVFQLFIFQSVIKNFISEMLLTLFLTSLLIYLMVTIILQWIRQVRQNKQSEIQLVETDYAYTKRMTVSTQESQKVEIINIQQLSQILQKQKRILQWNKLFTVSIILAITLLCVMIRGKKGNFQSIIGLNSCGIQGFLIIFFHFCLCLLYSLVMYKKAKNIQDKKLKFGYKFKSENEEITTTRRSMTMISGFLAGVLGASLGLGGAIILVPIWLKSGLNKQVATCSSSPLILCSATISITIELLCQNYHSPLFFILDLVLAFLASFLVKDLITFLTNKYKIKNMIYILLMITMVSSLGMILPFQFSKYMENKENFLKLGQFC